MSDDYAPGAVLESVALFPLPEVVLFPGTVLPLHIFEPRYRAMTRDLLAGDKRIIVSLMCTDRETDEHGHPQVPEVAGVGEVVRHEELDDGRYNILVLGRARARIVEHPFQPPYRRVRATLLTSNGQPPSEEDLAALVQGATSFASRLRKHDARFRLELPRTRDPGQLADACAHHLLLDGADRQSVLETLDVRARLRRITETLAVQEALLHRSRVVN